MGIQASQTVGVKTWSSWASPEEGKYSAQVDIKAKTLRASGITEDEARNKLAQDVQTECRFITLGKSWQVKRCAWQDVVQISIEKPNRLQRIGIAISDFFSTLFD